MRLIQVHHIFSNNNCKHHVYTATDVANLKYAPRVISTCNSSTYRVIPGAQEEDEFVDTFEYHHLDEISSRWMVFRFYENSIDAMSIFANYDEAVNEFDILCNMVPSDAESSVLERDVDCNAMYTLYIKSNGVYVLPDKAQRVVLQKINMFDDVTII